MPLGYSRNELIRTIGLWLAILVLVIFAYQLGQSNALNIVQMIQTYCPSNMNYDVGIFGSVSLWPNTTQAFIP